MLFDEQSVVVKAKSNIESQILEHRKVILNKQRRGPSGLVVAENERISDRELEHWLWKLVPFFVENRAECIRIGRVEREVFSDRSAGILNTGLERVPVLRVGHRPNKAVVDQLAILKRHNRRRKRIRGQDSRRCAMEHREVAN